MSKGNDNKRIKKLAVYLKVISSVYYRVSRVIIGICITLLIAINFFPTKYIDTLVSKNDSITSLSLGNMSFKLASGILTGKNFVYIISLNTINAIIVLSVTAYITLQLKRILTNVIENLPFNSDSIKYTKKLGYGVIAASIFSLINSLIYITMINKLKVGDLIINNKNVTGFTVGGNLNGVLLFTGLFIILLSDIFKYGSFLQKEFDATL